MTENQLRNLLVYQQETKQTAFKSFVYRVFTEVVQKLKYIEKYKINESMNSLYFNGVHKGLSIETRWFENSNIIRITVSQSDFDNLCHVNTNELCNLTYYVHEQDLSSNNGKIVYNNSLADTICDFIKPYLVE